jgi:hypothetical protein
VNTLIGFIYTYADGAAYYAGTVADDGSRGYAAIANSGTPFQTVTAPDGSTAGTYYLFTEGTTGMASGSVSVTYYRDGITGTTFKPASGGIDGTAGLGSESDRVAAGGGNFGFGPLAEAHPLLAS